MKKIIKYMVFIMTFLIVLTFSESSVFAEVKPPADNVAGSGTEDDPYVLNIGSSSAKRIVLDPEQIPFNFVVTGTGGVGGVFVVDYDLETGLVSFLLDKSVSSSDGADVASVYVAENNASTQQLGVKYAVVSEDKISFPTYDIQEVLRYNTNKKINLNLSNLGLQASYSNMARGDMYFFANQVQSKEDLDELFSASGYSIDENGDKLIYKKDGATEISISKEKMDFSIMYRFAGKSNSALSDEEVAENGSIEAIFTRLLLTVGDDFLLKMLIQRLFGKELTINSLIFNTYDGTKLEFYSGSTNELTSALTGVVNNWYKIFSSLAYILYVIILVYIGVMIIATSGTANQDKMKKSLGDWFVGLVIMLAVPTFVIPSLIKLNDAFVKYMYSKNSEQVTSYYTFYDVADDIIGGDSSTLSIEELMEIRNEESSQLEKFEKNKSTKIEQILDSLDKRLSKPMTDAEREHMRQKFIYLYDNAKTLVFEKEQGEEDDIELFGYILPDYQDTLVREVRVGKISSELASSSFQIFKKDYSFMQELVKIYREIYTSETKIDTIDQLIEVKSTDLMTVMRAYAGKYQRFIFAVVWFSLLFQLIALIFIYYKRIFIIALLITIFPLIMIFYCIDKMADGSAQTLSMWFNELLSNIFIQSIHCVIYTVLIQMGLEIYKADQSNWFLFLAAMLLLVPAEKILREIFGFGKLTLGKLGGMGEKIFAGAIAGIKLGRKGIVGAANKISGKKSKAFVDKVNKNFAKTQRRQDRADAKAAIRANKRATAGRTELSKFEKFREGVYATATKAREVKVKTAPMVAHAAETAKKAAAMGAGAAYGIATGGGLEGFNAGMEFTDNLMGSQGKMVSGKQANIKNELASAYRRKAGK